MWLGNEFTYLKDIAGIRQWSLESNLDPPS